MPDCDIDFSREQTAARGIVANVTDSSYGEIVLAAKFEWIEVDIHGY